MVLSRSVILFVYSKKSTDPSSKALWFWPFIAIEKTAGASLLRSLIQANMQSTYYPEHEYRIFSSYWQGRHAIQQAESLARHGTCHGSPEDMLTTKQEAEIETQLRRLGHIDQSQ